MRIRKEETNHLLRFDDALWVLVWPVAERYRVVDGLLYADGPPKWTTTKPLTEPDLFLSFARLGARGGPSQQRILGWVEEYGLLERKQDRDEEADDLGAPIKVDAFKAEVRKAHGALTLLEAIRGRDVNALRGRIGSEQKRHPKTGAYLNSVQVLVDGEPIPYITAADKRFSDGDVFRVSQFALEYFVERQLRGKVWPSFGRDVENPHPPLPYRPTLAWRCADLLSAAWFQLSLLVVDQRPWRNCEGCGRMFLATRKDKRVCDAACRKGKHRRLRSSGQR